MKKHIALIAALLAAVCILGGCTFSKEEETSVMRTLTAEEEAKMITLSSPFISEFEGYVGERVENNKRNWLDVAYAANPYIVEAIRQREGAPDATLVGWYGEFPGAFLLSAASSYKIDRDPALYETIAGLVNDIAAAQNDDGYLGPFPDESRLDGYLPGGNQKVWDIGGHFFMMLGMLEWHEATDSEQALDVCKKIANMLYDYHFIENRNFADNTMNQTVVILPLAKLYRLTQEPKYLELVNSILNTWRGPYAGDYLEHGYSGAEYSDLKNHRWENAFDVQALAEIYRYSGDERSLTALSNLWWSIIRGDRHSTGGFTSGETATGSPYTQGSIETCASIAWAALTIDYYKLTKDAYAIDELELTTFNALLGAQHPSGRWWTYDTPKEGTRMASPHELSWQSRAGSPEFNCCSANSARGIGLLNEWCLYREGETMYVNYYGPGRFTIATPAGNKMTLVQETDYPREGSIKLTLSMEKAERFALALRIPFWSEHSTVKVNGKELETPHSGQYYTITKEWKTGDVIELSLDLSLHFWAMEGKKANTVSIYRGPILLAADKRFNFGNTTLTYELDLKSISPELIAMDAYPAPLVALNVTDRTGNPVILCDFATAGATGTYYTTFFPSTDIPVLPISSVSRENIIWNQRPSQQ